jgi:hypothetical protein
VPNLERTPNGGHRIEEFAMSNAVVSLDKASVRRISGDHVWFASCSTEVEKSFVDYKRILWSSLLNLSTNSGGSYAINPRGEGKFPASTLFEIPGNRFGHYL